MNNKIFVVILRYLVSEKIVDEYRIDHINHLLKFYENGHLLISGPKDSKCGGVIIARGKTKEEIENIMYLDPFYTNNIAEFEIFDFTPARSCKELEFLLSKDD